MFELTRCGELTEGLESQSDSSHSLNKKRETKCSYGMRKCHEKTHFQRQ